MHEGRVAMVAHGMMMVARLWWRDGGVVKMVLRWWWCPEEKNRKRIGEVKRLLFCKELR